jgi:predicted transcriptional regulator
MKLRAWHEETKTPIPAIAESLKVSERSVYRYMDEHDPRMPETTVLVRLWTLTGGRVTANDFVPLTEAQKACSVESK